MHGNEESGGRVYKQSDIGKEVMKAIGDLNSGKAPGVDGITSELLRYSGEAVSD